MLASPSLVALAIAAPAVLQRDGAAVDFDRELRPLLASRCFTCHGPDAAARRADLRLDLPEGLFGARAGGAPVVRGDPAASALLRRVASPDPDERMPPREAGEPLAPDEVERLARWIDAGAPWSPHWSFVPPSRPAPPAVRRAPWARNPIDRFVLARLEAEGLEPAPEAQRATLLRRLTLDLTGLPPTLDELDAFLADPRPERWREERERLFASPRFGERMALEWLDAARYADTNGYSIDGGRHMWMWRDWVVDAWNRGMPFDRFTVEQLAGDLLPGATLRQRVATGFNRNHMITHEGGTIPEEYRVAYVADRVRTSSEAFMGLTLACAQCHDHKYDPLSQREYYRFFAFFDTVDELGNDGDGGRNARPFLRVPLSEHQAEIDALVALRALLRERLHAPSAELDAAQAEWERRLAARAPEGFELELGPWSLAGPFRAQTGAEAWARAFAPEQAVDLAASDSAGAPLWRPRPELADGVVHALEGEASAFYLARELVAPMALPVRLALGSDDGLRVWLDGELVLERDVQRAAAADQEDLRLTLSQGSNQLLLKVVNHGGPAGFFFRVAEAGPPPYVLGLLATPPAERDAAQRAQLARYFRLTAPELAEPRAQIAELGARIEALQTGEAPTVMVMQEMAEPRASFVLERGRYDLPGERVLPGTPGVLPPLILDPPGRRATRLDLARWLVSGEHPLTARVAVNRMWQLLFGRGLVATPADFGTQGARPSHPELLDWLAVELVESGWDLRHLLALIVDSATYRQSSRATPELLARDPDNVLLARGARFRLQAELVRDLALSVSGLLVERLGGPGVMPYQPAGLWREMSHFGSTAATAQVYEQGKGEDLWRRSLYTYWKRTVPPPAMAAFDAPTREVCSMQRSRTSTPLQALVLLNDPTFVEAARALAERILREVPLPMHGGQERTSAERARHGFRLATSRAPDAGELAVLEAALERELARFRARPAEAEALLAVGEAPRDASFEPAEHAAWTVVASILLNLGETITRP